MVHDFPGSKNQYVATIMKVDTLEEICPKMTDKPAVIA